MNLWTTRIVPNYQIGDTVRIKTLAEIEDSLDDEGETDEMGYNTSEMPWYCGKEFIIVDIDEREYASIYELDDLPANEDTDVINWCWCDQWFEYPPPKIPPVILEEDLFTI